MNPPVRILYHLPRPPFPVNGGDGARVVGLLDYFASRRGRIAVDLFSTLPIVRHRPADVTGDLMYWQPEQRRAAEAYGEHLYVNDQTQTLLDRATLKPVWFYHRQLRREELPVGSRLRTPPSYVNFVKRLVAGNRYDFIWLNIVRNARLATKVRQPGLRRVMDVHDVYSCSRASLKPGEITGMDAGLRFDYQASLRREVALLDKFDSVLVNSLAERQVLLDAGMAAGKLLWVPHISPNSEPAASDTPPYAGRAFEHELLYVGSSYRPNVDAMNFFLEQCFPQVLARFPSAKLSIVGSVCEKLTPPPAVAANVRLLGFVADLSAVYGRARVFVCPLRSGAGTKLKLVEAMSYGLPVVTTAVGASGMGLESERSAIVAADGNAAALTDGILRVLADPALAGRLSAGAQELFREHYSKKSIYARLDQMLGVGGEG